MSQSGHQEPVQRNTSDDLELWKHYAAVGGEDKNRMVTIVSFLLGVSAGVLGIIVGLPMEENKWLAFLQPRKAVMISALGIIISIVAAYTVFLYAGYANQNWQKADDIARIHGWNDLTPEGSPRRPELSRLVKFIYWLATECEPKRSIAPVFTVFAVLSFLFLLMHLVVLIGAVPAAWGSTS